MDGAFDSIFFKGFTNLNANILQIMEKNRYNYGLFSSIKNRKKCKRTKIKKYFFFPDYFWIAAGQRNVRQF